MRKKSIKHLISKFNHLTVVAIALLGLGGLATVTTTSIKPSTVQAATKPQGPWLKKNGYATITKKYNMYSNFNWDIKTKSSANYQKTYKINGMYHHSNGSTYYSLYGGKSGKWYGYINANAAKVTNVKQGAVMSASGYATVMKKYDTWSSFSWAKKIPAATAYQKTYQIKRKYAYSDGRTFYSIYDYHGNWAGYINAAGVKTASGAQGAVMKMPAENYATVTNKNCNVWANFNWKLALAPQNNYRRTYQVKYYYNHFNGSKYYSLYKYHGQWIGYINATCTAISVNQPQGLPTSASGYATIVKKNYTVWSNFNWNEALSTAKNYWRTYKIKNYYNHANGSKYYSLFDNNNKLVGYINATGTKLTTNPQGVALAHEDQFQVVKTGYPIYKDWGLSTQSVTANNAYNKVYQTKALYGHVNGHQYYSVWNNGKWIGYIDAAAVKIKTVTELNKIENDLNTQGLSAWNAYRLTKGLRALDGNSALQSGVNVRAEEIATLFDHKRPNGHDPMKVANEMFGYQSMVINENITYSTYSSLAQIKSQGVANAMSAWEHSEGHNINLLTSTGNEGAMAFHISKENGVYVLYAVTQAAINSTKPQSYVAVSVHYVTAEGAQILKTDFRAKDGSTVKPETSVFQNVHGTIVKYVPVNPSQVYTVKDDGKGGCDIYVTVKRA